MTNWQPSLEELSRVYWRVARFNFENQIESAEDVFSDENRAAATGLLTDLCEAVGFAEESDYAKVNADATPLTVPFSEDAPDAEAA